MTAAILCAFVGSSCLAATAKVEVDTKTHAMSIEDGSSVIDAKGITLTVGGLTIYDGAGVKTVVTGATSGAMFGATGNKIGFLGATPVIRPSSTTDIRQALINLGLYTTGGASPLNLNGGAFTSGPITATTFSGTNGTFSGNETIGGTLGVTGAITGPSLTLSANGSVGGTFTVTGASTLHAITGTNQTLSGTLGVTGNSTFGGTLGVTGATTLAGVNATNGAFSGTLAITGATSGATFTFTGNGSVGGTLGVTGATTLAALSATTGTFSSSISATNATLSGTLGITGALTGTSAAFSGNETIGGTLGVTGATTGSSYSFSGSGSVGGTFTATGNSTFGGTLSITGATSGAAFSFTGNGTVGGTLGVTGTLTGAAATFTNLSVGSFLGTTNSPRLSLDSNGILFNVLTGGNLAQNWIDMGSDASHLTGFLAFIDQGPGAVWDTVYSRALQVVANPATSAKPYSPTSIFLEGQYWNGTTSVWKGIELENKINAAGNSEFWIEQPEGSAIITITRDPSTNQAQIQPANQPGNTLELRAEDLGGGYQRIAYVSHYGFFVEHNLGFTPTSAVQSDYLKIGGVGSLGNATGSSFHVIRSFDASDLLTLSGSGDLTIPGTFTTGTSALDSFTFKPQNVAQTNFIRMGSNASLGAAQASLSNVIRNYDAVVVQSLNGQGDLSVLGTMSVGGTTAKWISGGAASPNGLVTASPGSIFTSTAGGAGTTLWVKESGTGNTGWVGK